MDSIEDRTKAFKCRQCNHEFFHPTTLKRHTEKIHNDNFSFKCTVCHKKFSKSFDLNAHIKSAHEKLKELKCDQCNKKFTRALDLDKHIRIQHNSITKLKCSTSGAVFNRHCNLDMHVKTVHTTLNSFQCIVCNNKFNSKNTLKTHIKEVHMGHENQECQTCHKKFYKIENYKEHIQIAHPEKNASLEFKFNPHIKDSIHVNMNELLNNKKINNSPEKVGNEKLSTDQTCEMLHQESNVKIQKSNEPNKNLVINTYVMDKKNEQCFLSLPQEFYEPDLQQTINNSKTENSLMDIFEENDLNEELKAVIVPENFHRQNLTITTLYSNEENGPNNKAIWNIVSETSVPIQCFYHNFLPTQTMGANSIGQNSDEIEYVNNIYLQNDSVAWNKENRNMHVKSQNDKKLPNINNSHETKFSHQEYSSYLIYENTVDQTFQQITPNIPTSKSMVLNHVPQQMMSFNGKCLPKVSNVENLVNYYSPQATFFNDGYLSTAINSQTVTTFNDSFLPNILNTENTVCHNPFQTPFLNELFPGVVNMENTGDQQSQQVTLSFKECSSNDESSNTERYYFNQEEPGVSYKNFEQTFPSESFIEDVLMNFEQTNMIVENLRQLPPYEIFNEYSKIEIFNLVNHNKNMNNLLIDDKANNINNQELNNTPFTCSQDDNFLDVIFHYYIDEFDKLIHGNDEVKLNNLFDELNKELPVIKCEDILNNIENVDIKMDTLSDKFIENFFEMVNFIGQVEDIENIFDT